MKKLLYLLISLIMLSCSDDDDKTEDINFYGITETDDSARQLGNVDYSDWLPFGIPLDSSSVNDSGAVHIIPHESSPSPAYPNPFNVITTLPISLNSQSTVSIKIWKDKNTMISQAIDRQVMNPGMYSINVGLPNKEPGIYRVTFDVINKGKEYHSFGDIKLVK